MRNITSYVMGFAGAMSPLTLYILLTITKTLCETKRLFTNYQDEFLLHN